MNLGTHPFLAMLIVFISGLIGTFIFIVLPISYFVNKGWLK